MSIEPEIGKTQADKKNKMEHFRSLIGMVVIFKNAIIFLGKQRD